MYIEVSNSYVNMGKTSQKQYYWECICSPNFHLNGIFVVSPSWSITPSGTQTSRPTEHKIAGKGGSKFLFANESLEVVLSGATPISIT